jgi:hypothetical protein
LALTRHGLKEIYTVDCNPTLDRWQRAQAIQDQAIIKWHLGPGARHLLLPDGQHRVTVLDRAAGVVRHYDAASLAEATTKAKQGQGHVSVDKVVNLPPLQRLGEPPT